MGDDVATHLRSLGCTPEHIRRHLNRGLDKHLPQQPERRMAVREVVVTAEAMTKYQLIAKQAWPLVDQGMTRADAARKLGYTHNAVAVALRNVPRPKIKRVRLVR